MLVWLYANNPARPRLGDARATIPPGAIYSQSVVNALIDLSLDGNNQHAVGDLAADSLASEWYSEFADMGFKVHGFALAVPLTIVELEESLSQGERSTQDFWNSTRYAHAPLMRIRLLEVHGLREALPIRLSIASRVPRGLFFKMSHASFDQNLHTVITSGTDVQHIVQGFSGFPVSFTPPLVVVKTKPSRWTVDAICKHMASGVPHEALVLNEVFVRGCLTPSVITWCRRSLAKFRCSREALS